MGLLGRLKSLYVQVLIAIALGILVGALWPTVGVALKPLGDAFIKLIKLVIAPVIFCTVAGGIGGQFIPAGAFGIDYALTAMFICLLVFQLRGIHHILVALFSGVVAVIVSLMIPGNSYILIAAFLAASAGLLLRKTKWRMNEKGGNS